MNGGNGCQINWQWNRKIWYSEKEQEVMDATKWSLLWTEMGFSHCYCHYVNKNCPHFSYMLSVFWASHSRLHWPVALRWRANLSSSICSRSFFQRRYSALSLPVIDMVMSTEPFGPGLRLYGDKKGHKWKAEWEKLIMWQYSKKGLVSKNPVYVGLNDLNPPPPNDVSYSPLFLQLCSCLHVIKVQPSPVSDMSPAALFAVCVWCGAWTSRVIQEVTDRLVSIRLRRTVLMLLVRLQVLLWL